MGELVTGKELLEALKDIAGTEKNFCLFLAWVNRLCTTLLSTDYTIDLSLLQRIWPSL